jgi:lipopolysaccharide biosynthesis glycosyltransferase
MKICYLISEDYLSLTLNSINYIKKFASCENELEFILFHFGDLDEVNLEGGVLKRKIPRYDYPFFIHRALMFDSLDEKVIFMDSDTICLTDISKLYNIDLEGNLLGVAAHNWLLTHKEAFKVYKPTVQLEKFIKRDDFTFFNAGVMLVDCKKWRELDATTKIFSFFENYRGEWYDWNDEVALNCLFGRNLCKFIDTRWNYNETGFGRPFIKHYYGHTKNLLQSVE